MLFSGVVQCAQKLATQHGACQALLAFWKQAMGSYHEAKKVSLISNKQILISIFPSVNIEKQPT